MGGSKCFESKELEGGECENLFSPKSSASLSHDNSCSSDKRQSSSTDKSTSMSSSVTSTPALFGKLDPKLISNLPQD